MISVNLMGGLGNMLFQIATGYSYSKMVNSPFYLMEGMKNFRNGDVDLFENKESYLKHCIHWEKYKKNIFKKIPIHSFRNLELLHHGCFKYVDLPLKKNVMLSGFFQSEKFFKHYSSEIKKLFDFDYKLKKKI